MTPRVSIITPTYNHARYVEQCVHSVLAQTDADWEQIIIDDASTDDTLTRIGQIQDPRIRVQRQAHRGIFQLAATYNNALADARGDLIAILEGDDFWPPDKLATLVPAFEDPGVILAFGTTVETDADGIPTGYTIPEPSFIKTFGDAALLNAPVGAATKVMFQKPAMTYTFPCSVIVRRQALEAIGGFQHVEGIPFIDYPTFLRLSLVGRYSFAPRVMGFWRRHGGSATALRSQDITDTLLLAFMRQFRDNHRPAMNLTKEDDDRITEALTEWERRIAVYRGRSALLEGRWSDARRHFRMALGARWPFVRVAGAVGTLASYAHVDIEWIVSIRARLFDRQTRVTGVQRRFGAAPRVSAGSKE